MRRLINGLTGWSVIYAAILILASPVATAPSEKGGASPEKGAPSEAAEPKAPPATAAAGEIQSPVKVKDILAEGFLITKKKLQLRFAITRSRLM
jgi:hypothetical protein